MRNLFKFGFIFGLQIICSVHSRSAGDTCARKPGVCVEAITEPYTLSEGPHWDDEAQLLYFVDIPKQKFYCYDPATKNVTNVYLKNGQVGVVVPVAGQKNTFIAGAGTDLIKFTWDPKTNSTDPKIEVLASVDGNRTGTRFNDGKVDPSGRFWAGTMGINMEPEFGSLYRFTKNSSEPKLMVAPVTISNGLAWSHDNKTFYYIDSPTKQVSAYDYNLGTGDISNKRVLFDFVKNNVSGIPDGMTIDNDGNLWVACFNGGKVICIDPKTGKMTRSVEIPAKQVTSAAFGGPKRDIMYVTTARIDYKDEDLKAQPLAGSVFAVKGLGTSGKPMLGYKM